MDALAGVLQWQLSLGKALHYSILALLATPVSMSLLNEFMCGPLDIQGIKGKTDAEGEHDTGSLPDWLINPEEYEPVVLTTEEHRAAEPTVSINSPRKLTPVYTYGSFN